MRSTRCIVSLRYTPVSGAGSIRRRVGGFLRYIQQRDHHHSEEKVRDVEGLLRYAQHRDRTQPDGRLFDREGDVGTKERRELGRYILRSVERLPAAKDPARDRRRACYRFVISPQDARGIDLRLLTREVMGQLERDCGQPLPPWIAAEHRNTAHPHVHVVLAARRPLENGRYQSLLITRQRLQRIKEATGLEMHRQREPERRREALQRLVSPDRGYPLERYGRRWSRALQRIAARYAREAEREAERIRQLDRGRERD